MDRVRLRECEFRLRNADVLRTSMAARLKPFVEKHAANPWIDVRPSAIEILVEVHACVDEYKAISEDVSKINIPITQEQAIGRRANILSFVQSSLPLCEGILHNILAIIKEEDQALG